MYIFIIFAFFFKHLTRKTDYIGSLGVFIDDKAYEQNSSYEPSDVRKVGVYLVETSLVGGRSARLSKLDLEIDIIRERERFEVEELRNANDDLSLNIFIRHKTYVGFYLDVFYLSNHLSSNSTFNVKMEVISILEEIFHVFGVIRVNQGTNNRDAD